jgi:protein-export membrane protein SecD
MLNTINKIRLAFLAILITAIGAVFLVFSTPIVEKGIAMPDFLKIPFRLGLDLQGGTHLIYRADVSQIPEDERDAATEGVRDVIERRVNAFGVSEPLVQTTKSGDEWRILIELAGIKDVNQAIAMIGETPLLEFKTLNPNPAVELTAEQNQELQTFNEEARKKADSMLAQATAENADFAKLAQENSDDTGSAQLGGDLDFLPRGQLLPDFEKVCFDEIAVGEVYKELLLTDFGYHIIKKTEERGEGDSYQARCSHVLVRILTKQDFISEDDAWLYAGLTGKQLKRAMVEFDPTSRQAQVSIEFNDEGKELFAKITSENIGRPVAIYLDGSQVSAPTVQEAITDGRAVISGNFTINDAKLLTQRLNAGALPVPIELISQQTIGATLGAQTLEKSILAGVIGLIVVSLFMILFYRLPGLLSVLALIFYGLIVLSIFKLIPVTLTLAGMAGFILSIGMAVDANILIFERLREELKAKKPLSIAIPDAFKRAWPSIFDGNVSTLLTCLILMWFTTSLVKGFAITLSIGIIVSMFSAMVVTRVLLLLLSKIKFFNKAGFYGYGIK